MTKARWLLALAAAGGLCLVVLHLWPHIVAVFADPGRLRASIVALGAWGPLGLVLLSAVQIVLAPVPGYLVQVAGGYVFGPWLGGVYGVVGMAMGATVAFLLARRFGVPLLQRLVPGRLLEGWLRLRSQSSLAAWVVVLLLPVGDFCYFLAGLTSLSLRRMLLGTVLVRGPTVFLAAFVGAQAAFLSREMLWLLAGAAVVLTVVILWQKDRLELFVYERLLVRILGKRDSENGKQG
jgi:uncharacterized membrane protein YdjX (TVP38/TMEM64 family)